MKVGGLFLVGLACVSVAHAQIPIERVGPNVRSRNMEFVPGRFIITLEDGVDPVNVAGEHGVTADFVYRNVINGFAGRVGEAAQQGLMGDRRVRTVERDGIVRTAQSTQSWALDRTDQRTRTLDNVYTRRFTGSGVTVYIVDTGIRDDHSELGGRAIRGYDDRAMELGLRQRDDFDSAESLVQLSERGNLYRAAHCDR